MDALHVVQVLHGAGLSLALTPELALKVTPASNLTAELRDMIRASKEALVGWLRKVPASNPPPLTDRDSKVPTKLEAHSTDPEHWAWPHSTAMNTAELDAFTARLARFTDMGMILADAERMADKLLIRDRESDDRRVCMECVNLHRGSRCRQWHRAGIATRSQDAQLPGDLVTMLQRCDGFSDPIPNLKGKIT
jgi:hypothetical protein